MPTTFTLTEAAPGIHAAIAPGFGGPAVSNAAIIDLGDKTVVVDTFMTILAADELAAAARDLTGRDTFLVVTSHFHGDHVGGNAAFLGTPFASTRATLELMRADAAPDKAAYGEEVDATLAAARAAVERAEDAAAEKAAHTFLSLAEAMDATRDRYTLVLPDLLVDDALVVTGSERSIEIRTLGKGHTQGDAFVFAPDEGALVAGDLVWSGVHPKTSDGFPGEWAHVLDSIAALGVTTVVPGHGGVSGADLVTDMASYMREIDSYVTAVREGSASVDDLEPPSIAAEWQGPDRMRAGIDAIVAR